VTKEIRMSKFSTGVPELLPHSLDYKPRFPRTAERRSLLPWRNRHKTSTSAATAGLEVSDSTAPNPARVAVEEHPAVAGDKSEMLRVRDVMSADVISVSPNTPVQEIAEIVVRNRISSVPVVDNTGRLLGVVSDGDLIRRIEIGTEPRRSWWHVVLHDAIAASYD
jgi:hypothetical protein